ncbi:hypothetical protein OUZ56_026221 [Daphnia magna]|uniref:Uncharacterized protein n=1 Tax=Daphnia magna TaxID=35525 RepID=A0ABQ9ZL40_9CRUS|nr:hypothetical protein OUZ56_026221 [Daphnia magna]
MQKTIKINTTMLKTVWNEKITRQLKKFGKILRDISTRKFETQVPTQEPAIIISAKQTPDNTSKGTSEAFSITIELPTMIGDQSSNGASKKLEENESLTKCTTLTVVQKDLTAISYYQNENQVFPKNIKINSVTWSMTTLCDPSPVVVYQAPSLSLVTRQYNILLHGGDAEPRVSLFGGCVSLRFCAAEAVAVRDP